MLYLLRYKKATKNLLKIDILHAEKEYEQNPKLWIEVYADRKVLNHEYYSYQVSSQLYVNIDDFVSFLCIHTHMHQHFLDFATQLLWKLPKIKSSIEFGNFQKRLSTREKKIKRIVLDCIRRGWIKSDNERQKLYIESTDNGFARFSGWFKVWLEDVKPVWFIISALLLFSFQYILKLIKYILDKY